MEKSPNFSLRKLVIRFPELTLIQQSTFIQDFAPRILLVVNSDSRSGIKDIKIYFVKNLKQRTDRHIDASTVQHSATTN